MLQCEAEHRVWERKDEHSSELLVGDGEVMAR